MRGHMQERSPDSWRLTVYVGRDERTGRKRYAQRTFHGTKREAQRSLAHLVTEVDEGRHSTSAAGTVNALFDRWLETKALSVEETTLASYRWVADKYLRPEIGKARLSSLKPADLDALYSELARSGGTDGKKLSPRTIRICHGVMRQSLEQARRWGLITRNPALDASPPRSRHHEIRPPSVEQVGRILDAAQKDDPDFGTFLRVLAATGCRRGEALALRWTDIDWDKRELVIARSVTTVGPQVIEKETKTHQIRRLSLDAGTLIALKAHLREAKRRVGAAGGQLPISAFVFSSDAEGQRPWRPDVTTHRFIRLCESLGVEGVRLHDLRHYVASALGAAGTPLATISARLGHRDKATTLNVYQHTMPAQDHQAAEILGVLLDGG